MTRSEAKGLLDPFGLEKNGVKKAFRKAALYWHPDRGGDAGVFGKMVEARDVLLEKKNIWDTFEYMKPEGPFAGAFHHFEAPFQHSYKNSWRENYEQHRARVEEEEGPRGRNTSQERIERYQERLRAYGRIGKVTFTLNGKKFDIYL